MHPATRCLSLPMLFQAIIKEMIISAAFIRAHTLTAAIDLRSRQPPKSPGRCINRLYWCVYTSYARTRTQTKIWVSTPASIYWRRFLSPAARDNTRYSFCSVYLWTWVHIGVIYNMSARADHVSNNVREQKAYLGRTRDPPSFFWNCWKKNPANIREKVSIYCY